MPDIAELPLVVSVSGGETSMVMAKRLKDRFEGHRPMLFIVANTSREREETLIFLNRADKEYGLNLVWVEAVVNPVHGEGTTHKVVSFESARRNGEVFEEVIKKYGIPNAAFPHCTRELKTNPIRSYVKAVMGWDKYVTAIGYRADEPRRIKWKKAEKLKQLYPLAETWRMDKPAVKRHWKIQPFQLGLKEHEGNCKNCWKKSKNKLLTGIVERPQDLAWIVEMEKKYGWFTPPTRDPSKSAPPYTFFRGSESALDLIEDSKHPFKKFVELGDVEAMMFSDPDDHEPDDCGSGSCEPFALEEEAEQV